LEKQPQTICPKKNNPIPDFGLEEHPQRRISKKRKEIPRRSSSRRRRKQEDVQQGSVANLLDLQER
jgi:hypothetical protein